jgi:hypothetical protein
MSSNELSRTALAEDIFSIICKLEGVKLLPDTKLTPLAELFPDIRVDCSAGDKINPIWLEIYNLRKEGLRVEPASAIANAGDIAILFCKNESTIPQDDIGLMKAIYELHKEFFPETALDATKYIGLIYARLYQNKLHKTHYQIPKSEIEFDDFWWKEIKPSFENFLCETTRYFCYWTADMLNRRSNYESSKKWAVHAYRETKNIPWNNPLATNIYKLLLRNFARTQEWEEFDKHYDTLVGWSVELDLQNGLYNYIKQYAEESPISELDLHSYSAPDFDEAEFVDITEIKFVSVGDLPEMAIAFDVVLEAEFMVKVALDGLYSAKTGKTYSAVLCLDDTGTWVNFKLEFKKNKKKS